jgi:hypothetical protein
MRWRAPGCRKAPVENANRSFAIVAALANNSPPRSAPVLEHSPFWTIVAENEISKIVYRRAVMIYCRVVFRRRSGLGTSTIRVRPVLVISAHRSE